MHSTTTRDDPRESVLPVITELDAARIRELPARLPDRGQGIPSLPKLLELVMTEAEIVPSASVASNIVTVNSTVTFRDELTETEHTATIVYPQDAAPSERRISVLSPMGMALIGRRVGAVTECAMPDGTLRDIRILELHYQPEAAGDIGR